MPQRAKRSRTRQRGPAGPASPHFRIADYPFYLIARVGALYTRRLERALKPRGMDQAMWRVLMILAEHDGASMGLIAELSVMKLTTLFKLVRRMGDDGLLQATPRPSDRRVIDLRITERGQRELARQHQPRGTTASYHHRVFGHGNSSSG